MTKPEGAGVFAYLKEAFLFRWNLLGFLGGTVAALLSGSADIVMPLLLAGELVYLTGLVSIPRFRAAVDAKVHARGKVPPIQKRRQQKSLNELLVGLDSQARMRFQKLRQRCVEMQRLGRDVRGRAGGGGTATEDVSTPSLDRLLWIFLRLLYSQQALKRFLDTTDEEAIQGQLERLTASMEKSRERGDERIVRSLQDSIATAELRLDNYRKAESNAEFVAIELDRIEGKTQALTEMAISHQDPDYISSQVDSVAASMKHTEKAIRELSQLTGLDDVDETPAIMESNLIIEGR